MSAPAYRVAGPEGTLRIALLGTGTVGRALLARLHGLDDPRLRLVLIANSRRRRVADALFAHDPDALLAALADGEPHADDGSLPALGPGDVVVDATASEDLAACHPRWLRRGLHVVTANKRGVGGPLLREREIRALAGPACRYGDAATVGAGLPLLRTLRALRAGGDRITAIAGVLSGTLGWLFDGYDGRAPFSGRVREAVRLGFAEPDPRVDLSGEDVRRKLLILARAAGHPLAEADIRVDSLLTPPLRAASPAGTAAALDTLDATVPPLARRAAAGGRVLRHVARFDAGGARIGLEALAPDDPLASGRGSDNRVAIWSTRYPDRPLQIQGPGAGPGVTAAALLDDLLRVAG